MRNLWRISIYADLSGEGGRLASARWHTKGKPVVYLAESPAGAMIESLVHMGYTGGRLPQHYDLLVIDAAENIAVKEIERLQGSSWKQDLDLTRRLGDMWLASQETALARVPSAIVPRTWNILLNPTHPDANQVTIQEVIRERFDNRLFRFEAR